MKNALDAIKLAAGRLIGLATRTDEDLIKMWKEKCKKDGISQADRLIQLIKWDMQGEINEIPQQQPQEKPEEIKKIEQANAVAQMAELMTQMASSYSANLTQLTMQQMRQQAELLQELKRMRAAFGGENGRGD